ncbi:DUF2802 domain-containing protein [Thalassomonas viridans]|uniref:DUF2802 domain-containing protein n=2 Tax=Thalassomonas viridans TaxID=137584 RepID=A0AAF0CCC4_9GAMM|nr:DUF2802 domain-containing protein [Thalassomonas viridans]
MLRSLKAKLMLLEAQVQAYPLLMEELQTGIAEQQAFMRAMDEKHGHRGLEHEQVSKQLTHRVKVVQDELTKVKEMFEHYQEQQPEDKLYSRAYKLAELGADVEEIINECDLPRAEAEMLLSVYKKKIR